MKIRQRRSDRSGRAPLSSPGRPSVAGRDERRRFWAAIAVGLESEDAALEAGVPPAVGTRWFRKAGDTTRDVWTIGQAALGPVSLVRGAGGNRASSRAGLLNAGSCSPARAGSVDDLTGVAAQCRHSKRRSGVSRDDSAMACRASRSPAKAGEACDQHGIASLCGGTTGWQRRRSERGSCARPSRVLERPPTWTAEGSAVGKRLEPGADRPPAPGRLPGR